MLYIWPCDVTVIRPNRGTKVSVFAKAFQRYPICTGVCVCVCVCGGGGGVGEGGLQYSIFSVKMKQMWDKSTILSGDLPN